MFIVTFREVTDREHHVPRSLEVELIFGRFVFRLFRGGPL